MDNGYIYLTRDGYNKLKDELDALKTVKRRQLSDAIGEARLHGDISENAEYDAAKEAQAFNEKRISELAEKLSRARIIDDFEVVEGEVRIGATVLLVNQDTDQEEKYTIVSELEADYEQGKISLTSPLAKGLLGHKESELVEIKIPRGVLKYKIVKISR